MCNINNTELIRQQLWCDIITSNNLELTFDKVLAEADKVVAEFDKRFNDKLRCKDDGPFDFLSYPSDKNEVIEIKPFRDTTTYIERGLKPREIVKTESTQVAPAPPKDRTIKETGFSFKNLFRF